MDPRGSDRLGLRGLHGLWVKLTDRIYKDFEVQKDTSSMSHKFQKAFGVLDFAKLCDFPLGTIPDLYIGLQCICRLFPGGSRFL